METKDWLALFIPIIFNGLLLFLFQQAIIRNNKRAERRNDYQYQTLTHFLDLLQRFYTAFRAIQAVDTTVSGKQITFADAWNPAAELMQQLVVYYDTHPVALKKVETQFQRCKEQWTNIASQLLQIRKNEGGKFTQEATEQFNKEYEIMDILVRECLKQCETQIIKM